jgi:hypothetical protein
MHEEGGDGMLVGPGLAVWYDAMCRGKGMSGEENDMEARRKRCRTTKGKQDLLESRTRRGSYVVVVSPVSRAMCGVTDCA